MSKQKIWSESYNVASYSVNLKGRAGLYTVLNYIQDVGWQHARHLQIQLPENRGWVFTRQKLIMNYWPKWSENIQIKTWLRPATTDFFLIRDYELYCGENKIGICSSTFSVIDTVARKLAPLNWQDYAHVWNENGPLPFVPEKIAPAMEAENLVDFHVRNSDIDLNNHVNNTKYAQWILDAVPIDILKSNIILKEYEVNFLAESKIGDVIKLQKFENNSEDILADQIVHFQGLRATDNKFVFTAKLKIAKERV